MRLMQRGRMANVGSESLALGSKARLGQLFLLSVLAGCSPATPEVSAAAASRDGTAEQRSAASTQSVDSPALPGANPSESDRRGASFDCGKAKTHIERLICSAPQLADLDGALARAYAAATVAMEASSKSLLKEEQRHWLEHTRNPCTDVACLTQVYSSRIDVLSRNDSTLINPVSCRSFDGATDCLNVVTYRDANARLDGFNKAMREHRHEGKVLGCKVLIDIAAGTASGNHTFGGQCTLEAQSKRSEVNICYDQMVGNFAIEPLDALAEPNKALSSFTYKKCIDA